MIEAVVMEEAPVMETEAMNYNVDVWSQAELKEMKTVEFVRTLVPFVAFANIGLKALRYRSSATYYTEGTASSNLWKWNLWTTHYRQITFWTILGTFQLLSQFDIAAYINVSLWLTIFSIGGMLDLISWGIQEYLVQTTYSECQSTSDADICAMADRIK